MKVRECGILGFWKYLNKYFDILNQHLNGLKERTGKNMDLGLFSVIEREISVRVELWGLNLNAVDLQK